MQDLSTIFAVVWDSEGSPSYAAPIVSEARIVKPTAGMILLIA